MTLSDDKPAVVPSDRAQSRSVYAEKALLELRVTSLLHSLRDIAASKSLLHAHSVALVAIKMDEEKG